MDKRKIIIEDDVKNSSDEKSDSDSDVLLDDIENDSDSESEQDEEELIEIEKKFENPTVISLYHSYFKRNRINLRPNYQREFTWSFEKMCLFIDSIRKGYVIPLFILYKLSDEERKKLKSTESSYDYECVDGQHRLYVLKHYLESEMVSIGGIQKYIYWTDKKTKEKVFFNLTQEIKNKYKKGIRAMTIDEIKAFEDTQFPFLFIQSKLNDEQKCDIFNRLQNGEKVNDVTKLKNINHPLTAFLRNNEIIKPKIEADWSDIIKLKSNKVVTKQNSNTICHSSVTNQNMNYLSYMVIRLFYVIDKNTLDINYLNLNIREALKANTQKSMISNDMDKILKKIYTIRDYIKKYLKEEKLIAELYIILTYITFTNKELIKNLSNDKIRNNILSKYNDVNNFKTSDAKIVTNVGVMKASKEIIKMLEGEKNKYGLTDKELKEYKEILDEEQLEQYHDIISNQNKKNKSVKK